MRGQSASNLGVADIPMRILIASVVFSVAVPAIWSAYSQLSVNMTMVSLEEEISGLLGMVKEVMDGGVGSSVEVEVRLEHWGSARVESVVVGGALNGSSAVFLVTYEISGLGRGFMCLDPPIPMTGPDGVDGSVLGEGTFRIRLRHGSLQEKSVCMVEVL